MDFSTIDYNHLLKVALAGAATAVIADLVHSNFGGEFSGILTTIQGYIANILQTASNAQTGGTTGGTA